MQKESVSSATTVHKAAQKRAELVYLFVFKSVRFVFRYVLFIVIDMFIVRCSNYSNCITVCCQKLP